MKLTLDDLRNVFDPGTYGRGAAYRREGRVMEALVRPDGSILGIVEGENGQQTQSIAVQSVRKGITVVGKCSCEVAVNCKHVAAVLIELAVEGEEIIAVTRTFESALTREQRDWLSEFDQNFLQSDSPPHRNLTNQPRLAYLVDVLERGEQGRCVRVRAVTARPSDGGKSIQGPFRMPHYFSGAWPKYVPDGDRVLLSLLSRNFLPGSTTEGSFQLSGPLGEFFFHQIVQSGKAHWSDLDGPKLALGEPRQGRCQWILREDGAQQFSIKTDPQSLVLPLWNPWWIDLESLHCGPIVVDEDEKLVRAMVTAPPVHPDQSEAFAEELRRRLPNAESLLPDAQFETEEVKEIAIPVLQLLSITASPFRSIVNSGGSPNWVVGVLSFKYGEDVVHWSDSRSLITKLNGRTLIRKHRDSPFEQECLRKLYVAGWGPINAVRRDFKFPSKHAEDFVMFSGAHRTASLASMDAVLSFIFRHVDALRAEGWEVHIDPAIDVPISGVAQKWDIRIDEMDSNWFELNLGIEVDGEQIDLMPVLLKMTTSLYRSHLKTVPDDQPIFGQLPDGRRIAMPASRVKPLVETLFELYDYDPPTSGAKRFAKWRAAQVSALERISESASLNWSGAPRLREMGARINDSKGIPPVSPPSSFCGELREYQREGLGWLQFLREFGLSGVLADDMGLGKTVQTLAHLTIEHEAGRLDRPCLIVAPTSLMTNWRLEAQRFAPQLKVLTIHGPERKSLFHEIKGAHIVLTTYALLARDMPELEKHHYHLVLLDEAQNIKNPKTNAARAARTLKSDQRLCLTGTPIENHLGELWSIFDFLLPGFLGNEQQFQRNYRVPIEKSNNKDRQLSLSRRVKPFMLRRTKEQVVKELPPKTEIVEHIDLHGSQRDLYESIRLAMHGRVRDAVQRQGVSKSHIVILDALLKLRQACCDPRLVKLESAKSVEQSAKLERLIEMLLEMLSEGRRILVFSQFTSMLALIEIELSKLRIDYALLTGETQDRGSQVERFQRGDVPVFLLSLKAGGTGLNLTAADTVIHYDPWWNPAVERQASDRAHRIGQDKPVFVYKLCTLGTVEEKIQELQAKKQHLADALFDETSDSAIRLTTEDIDWIFSN